MLSIQALKRRVLQRLIMLRTSLIGPSNPDVHLSTAPSTYSSLHLSEKWKRRPVSKLGIPATDSEDVPQIRFHLPMIAAVKRSNAVDNPTSLLSFYPAPACYARHDSISHFRRSSEWGFRGLPLKGKLITKARFPRSRVSRDR